GRVQAGRLCVPRLHAHLREDEVQCVLHGSAADHPQAIAGQTERGATRAAKAHACPRPSAGSVAAVGCRWAHPLLRRAFEQPGAPPLPIPSRLALAPCLVASEPERPSPLEPDAANHRPMVASRSRVPPLSPEATWRHYLRQEPDAGKPLVRICAGGYEQSWFLLRLGRWLIPSPSRRSSPKSPLRRRKPMAVGVGTGRRGSGLSESSRVSRPLARARVLVPNNAPAVANAWGSVRSDGRTTRSTTRRWSTRSRSKPP